MIQETNNWIWSYNPNNPRPDGKWIIQDTLKNIRAVFPRIDELVDAGKILIAKYTHKKNPYSGPLPLSKPVMCVYATEETKQQTKAELERLAIHPEIWKTEEETEKDWAPDGKLKKQSEIERIIVLFDALDKSN